jgi:hypothetical protein
LLSFHFSIYILGKKFNNAKIVIARAIGGEEGGRKSKEEDE